LLISDTARNDRIGAPSVPEVSRRRVLALEVDCSGLVQYVNLADITRGFLSGISSPSLSPSISLALCLSFLVAAALSGSRNSELSLPIRAFPSSEFPARNLSARGIFAASTAEFLWPLRDLSRAVEINDRGGARLSKR